ncbi:MAG: hypothetical protein RBU30_08870, partial [Polyangia bacterium]|nr:hypothetical protein [Polyangia bacterium]
MGLRDLITSIAIEYKDGKAKAVITDTAKLKTGLEQAAAKADAFGRRMGQAFAMAKVAVGAFMASRALRLVTTAYAEQGDQAAKTSQGLGMTTEEYTRLAYAAEANGLAITEVGTATGKLARRAAEAAAGNAEAAKSWKDLGVDIKDAGGKLKTPMELLEATADAFAAMPDGTKKTAAALKFFEESGAKFVPFLNKGSKGIREMAAESDRLGRTISSAAGKDAVKFKLEMQRINSVILGVRNQIGAALIPVITRGMEAFSRWAQEGTNLKDTLHTLKQVAQVAGAALGLLAARKIASWAIGAARAAWGLAAALRGVGMAGAAAQAKMALLLAAGAAI